MELLNHDEKNRDIIRWTGKEGEFKLIEKNIVAKLWGVRKNRPNMNYEKLSRALRTYYDGSIIAKVNGEHFTYKFSCDLRQIKWDIVHES